MFVLFYDRNILTFNEHTKWNLQNTVMTLASVLGTCFNALLKKQENQKPDA